MGLFKNFKTDRNLEKEGIQYTPDSSTVITLARAGGTNVRFAKVLEAKTKPYRRQIDAGTLDPKIDKLMMAEVFAETVIKSWETLIGEEDKEQLVPGIEADPDAKDGTYSCAVDKNGLVPFNKQNVVATLLALPDVFQDIQREANRMSNYLTQAREDDAKN